MDDERTRQRTFPMRDGPSLPWRAAIPLWYAYKQFTSSVTSMEELARRGGLPWAQIPTLMQQLKRRDAGLYALIIKVSNFPEALPELEAYASGVPLAPPVAYDPDLAGDPVTVVCWKWKPSSGQKPINYAAEHVNVLYRMVRRHYSRLKRFVCITDEAKGLDSDIEAFPLWADHARILNPSGAQLPSCYRRLKLFDPDIANQLGTRIVSLDLDLVITGDLGPLWDRPEPFIGWMAPSTAHGHVYNGSMWLFHAGTHADIWNKFDPGASPKVTTKARYFGSDQAWISYMVGQKAAGWTAADGVYSFPRDVKRTARMPSNARMVIFHGSLKPWDRNLLANQKWIKDHWR
jgi:hypothetical protein